MTGPFPPWPGVQRSTRSSVALAATPVDPAQLDLLSCLAESTTPLGKLHADDFRQACEAVAFNDIVDPNLVSAWLHARFGDINPRWYAAQWAPACGPKGFMSTLAETVPIDGRHSKGNSNKAVHLRRLRRA